MAASKLARNHQGTTAFAKHLTCRPLRRKTGPVASDEAIRQPVSNAIASNIRDILSVASRAASMPDREAIQRYHALIDKSLVMSLSPTERFELERIEARLDAGDRDPLVEKRNREMATERARILDSIHTLLAKLQS